jgi:hypothetical protein
VAFPASSVLDSFNRANGALGANWTNEPFGPSNGSVAAAIASNAVQAGAGGYSAMYWSAATFDRSNGIEVIVTIAALPAVNASNGVWLDCLQQPSSASNTADGYQAEVKFGATHALRLIRYTNVTTASVLVASTNLPANLVAGDKIGMEVTAAGAINVYTFQSGAWTLRITATDTTFTGAGFSIGWESFDSARAIRIDDFGGGAITGGGTSDTAPQGIGAGSGTSPTASVAAAQGVSAAAVLSPTASATAAQGAAAGQGITPSSNAAATPTPGAGTGAGSPPTARTTAATGAGQGQGVAPAAESTATLGQGVGAGLTPSVRALVTQGVGTGSGIQPTDSQGGSSDSAPQGLAHGFGVSPVAAHAATVGVATGFGAAPSASTTALTGTGSGLGVAPGASTAATPVPGVGTGQGLSPGVVVTVAQKVSVAAGISPAGARVVAGQGLGQGVGRAPVLPGSPVGGLHVLEAGLSTVFAEATGTARARFEDHATVAIID